MKVEYSCIIFDCDGVLVDSESISAKVFQAMVNELGCNLDFERVLTQITGTSMKENLMFFAERVGRDLPDNFEKEFRKRSFEAFKTDLKPIRGIHSLLDKITVPFCTASSGPPEKIRLNLTSVDLIDKFENNIYSSYDIGSWKPEPGIYLHAAKQMGFEVQDCVVIEDSIAGVEAAKAGNFNVFALANKNNKGTFEKLGAHTFCDMEELSRFLKIE